MVIMPSRNEVVKGVGISTLEIPVKKRKTTIGSNLNHLAQIQYVEFTDDGHVRHPSFQGLRHDK
ncbi:hypothetical protein D4L85_32020 [Chryseolinea soli]|uniref:DNA ligase (ATP) n=1 Tax=Chryseolinea soli TaxID=2321403 RepID=A0A385SWI9_9BACT|nr:hypothetical protein D4L85_32020 [Chryseolinea soli]